MKELSGAETVFYTADEQVDEFIHLDAYCPERAHSDATETSIGPLKFVSDRDFCDHCADGVTYTDD